MSPITILAVALCGAVLVGLCRGWALSTGHPRGSGLPGRLRGPDPTRRLACPASSA